MNHSQNKLQLLSSSWSNEWMQLNEGMSIWKSVQYMLKKSSSERYGIVSHLCLNFSVLREATCFFDEATVINVIPCGVSLSSVALVEVAGYTGGSGTIMSAPSLGIIFIIPWIGIADFFLWIHVDIQTVQPDCTDASLSMVPNVTPIYIFTLIVGFHIIAGQVINRLGGQRGFEALDFFINKSILMVMPTQCHCDCWCCSSYWVHTGHYYFQQRGSIISNDFDVWIKPDKQIKWTYVILVQTMEFPVWHFWYQRYWHLILHLVRFD